MKLLYTEDSKKSGQVGPRLEESLDKLQASEEEVSEGEAGASRHGPDWSD